MAKQYEMQSFPVICLDYNNKQNAVKKEMIINYSTGDIYIASPNDPSVLIDVTAKIKESVQNIQGDNIPVTIDGIGVITLNKLLIEIINKVDNGLEVEALGSSGIKYLLKPGSVDDTTIIQDDDSVIKIKGFNEASTLMIPRKGEDGGLEWVTLTQLAQDVANAAQDAPNPIDGLSEKIYTIEATNQKIYLRMDARQKTINPQQTNLNVILPVIVDDYANAVWLLQLGNNVPKLNFDSNVIFEYNGYYQPVNPNSYYLYKFETFDAGATWLGKYRPFNIPLSGSDVDNVKQSYLSDHYYTKEQVDDLISWNIAKLGK